MTLWDDLERRIRERGFRVEERLRLLEALRQGVPPADLAQQQLERVERAARDVRREAME